jgi:hypothetical protein
MDMFIVDLAERGKMVLRLSIPRSKFLSIWCVKPFRTSPSTWIFVPTWAFAMLGIHRAQWSLKGNDGYLRRKIW